MRDSHPQDESHTLTITGQLDTSKPNLNNVPLKDDWVKQLLDVTIEAKQPLWADPRQHFRGGEVGAACSRALTFKLAGHNVPYKAKTLRIFRTGNKIEDAIVEVFEKAKVVEGKQETLTTDGCTWGDEPLPPIRGKSDVRLAHEDEQIIGEIKSISHRGFEALPKEHGPMLASESPLMLKKPHYVHQLNSYLVMDGRDLGFLLFENKDDGEQRCYWLQRDVALFEQGLTALREAHPYAVRGEIAPIPANRDPFKGDKVCVDCPARYLCKITPEEGCEIELAKVADASVRG